MKKFATFIALVAAAAAVHAAPETFKTEPTHTFVNYETKHMGLSFNRGRFDKTEGTITLDTAARKGSVDITIDPASANTGVQKMNEHLQGEDFFNTAKFPTVTFKGDKFKFDARGNVKSVDGQLTLLGQSHPVTLKANHFACIDSHPFFKTKVCGGDFETTIDRTKWGMDYGTKMPGMNSNVRLVIQVEAIKQP